MTLDIQPMIDIAVVVMDMAVVEQGTVNIPVADLLALELAEYWP